MIGKTVLITGVTSGLGESLTEHCIKRGAYVYGIGRNKVKLNQLKQRYGNHFDFDVVDLNQHENIILFTEKFNQSIDYLICNAGVGLFKSIEAHSNENILNIIQTNFTNTVLFIKLLIKNLNNGATVVSITSMSAKVSTPYASVYAASKSAIYHFINSIRLEHPNISFLTINTGPVETPFHKKAASNHPRIQKLIMIDPNKLADDIILAIINKKIELNKPNWMHAMLSIYQIAPRSFDKYFKKLMLTKKT